MTTYFETFTYCKDCKYYSEKGTLFSYCPIRRNITYMNESDFTSNCGIRGKSKYTIDLLLKTPRPKWLGGRLIEKIHEYSRT